MYRRKFLKTVAGAGGGLMIGGFGPLAYSTPAPSSWRPLGAGKAEVPTRNSAKNLIFILLEGGPSHVDTFDLKVGSQTPAFFDAQSVDGLLWPAGIMPRLAAMTDRFSLVRSLTAVEAVHERAVYHLTTAHQPDASRISEIPHFGSVVSYMLAEERRAEDSLPTAVLFGLNPAKNGFLPVEHRGLAVTANGFVANLRDRFPGSERRFDTFNRLTAMMASEGDRRQERVHIQNQAQQIMNDTELEELLGLERQPGQPDRPMASVFLQQCEAVTGILEADKGTRFIQMSLGGWDHHNNIYARNGLSLPDLAGTLDEGLAYLLETLAAKPAQHGGGSLLDETLIVAAGEFGRTTGALNENMGRDHFPYAMSAFVAGGGVRGGRVVGATDAQGSTIVDPGWSHLRFMGIADLTATMYSALGIDWSQRFTDTPSGRPFEIVPLTRLGQVNEIDALFG